MPASSPRFARQVRLPEIGASGQARIETGKLELGGHLDALGRDVARRYAKGAGLAGEVETATVSPPSALGHFRHAAPRSVAAGALCALTAIREALAT
jgi:hypothetical protein